jgi:hypothetical protein
MEHIRFFINQKLSLLTKRAHEGATPASKGALTASGAKLMALGSERPYRKTAYNVRLYQP